MANLVLLYPDYVQPGPLFTAAITGPAGAWLPTLPLTNLQGTLISHGARSVDTDPDNTQFVVDLGCVRQIDMLAIGRINASSTGLLSLTFSEHADLSAAVAVPDIPLWPAGKTVEDVDGYNLGFDYIPAAAISARYIAFDIEDPDNPAGFVELARLLIGGKFQPETNTEYGKTDIDWDDSDTKSDRSLGGVDWFDVRIDFRVLRFALNHMNEAEAFDKVFEMKRRLGQHGQSYIIFDPDDTGFRRLQRSFLCTFRKLSGIEWPYFAAHGAAFEVKETVGTVVNRQYTEVVSDGVIDGGTF